MNAERKYCMVDAHVHLEKGNYCAEWVWKFIQYAISRNIDEIYFLEHTHIFKECHSLYDKMSGYNEYQNRWYRKKYENARPLKEYTDFIDNMRKERFPIKLKFGLEVCYSPEHERDIEQIKNMYSFDFLVGAIHFIDGWAFSHKKQPWKKEAMDLERLYHRYYELMYELVQSKLFSGLAHPNSLQCFGAYPIGDFQAEYNRIGEALKENKMYIEESSGLRINYGDRELGMNEKMLRVMVSRNVQIVTASDAHSPLNVGKGIAEMNELILRAKRNMNAG